VNLSASALTGPGGASIPASSVTLYREYYIMVTGTANYGGGGNPPLRSGTYPEPLIPFNNPETGRRCVEVAPRLKLAMPRSARDRISRTGSTFPFRVEPRIVRRGRIRQYFCYCRSRNGQRSGHANSVEFRVASAALGTFDLAALADARRDTGDCDRNRPSDRGNANNVFSSVASQVAQ